MNTITREEKGYILDTFVRKSGDLIEVMRNTYHSNDGVPNPFHLEDDVWSHTMMVFNGTKTRNGAIASLFHDIGKASTRQVRERDGRLRASFKGHESYSFYTNRDALDNFDLSEKDKKEILISIALHGSFRSNDIPQFIEKIKGFDDDLIITLSDLLEADSNGRICTDSGIWQHDVEEILFNGILECERTLNENNVKFKERKAHFLVGLPASGKSTFLEENKGQFEGFTLISRDDYIEKNVKGSNYEEKFGAMKNNSRIENQINKEFGELIKRSFESLENVIIDMTNISKVDRGKILKEAYKRDYITECTVFTTGLEDIISRNKSRKGKTVPSDKLHSMAKRFEFPLYDEFDLINIL